MCHCLLVLLRKFADRDRVACGIMVGFAFNLITTTAGQDHKLTVALILGAPVVPAMVLIVALWRCPESPRYYLRLEKPNYTRAFAELKKLRSKCEASLLLPPRATCHLADRLCVKLLAYKDMYLLHKSIEEECKYAVRGEVRLFFWTS